ncbi:TlpA family protein disulfide reductase [Dyadobacter tibetensis]|uniref:TlpA family protein disulfide reductase n=1 Tax=Dyadobacter tibetensis TaxID=1211851 RepID=UPI00046E662C|nr:TlpA disulfide reductase family protein [Dyadobacter tibetensis]
MKSHLLIIFLIFSFNSGLVIADIVSADSILVLTNTTPHKTDPTRIIKGTKIQDLDAFKGIPTQWDHYSIYQLSFQNDSIADRVPKHSKLNVLSGLLKNEKYIIADLNRDNDFSDDEKFVFPIVKSARKKAVDAVENIMLDYEYFHKAIFRRKVPVKILPYEPHFLSAISTEEFLEVYFEVTNTKHANIEIDGKNYNLSFSKSGEVDANYSNTHFKITDNDEETKLAVTPEPKIGDPFRLGERSVTIKHVSFFGDSLLLNIEKEPYTSGIRHHNRLPQEITHLLKSKIEDSSFFDHDYMLIDFWGSWCAPCIQAIPDLKKIHSQFGASKVLGMVSIAWERSRDTTKLQKLIKQYNMNWQHVFEIGAIDDPLVQLFHIEAFPTTILIDKNMNILYRAEGSDMVSNVTNLIK